MSERTPRAVARLTRNALRAAAAEGLTDARSIAEFLYRFNSVAPSARWEREYPDLESTAAALGVGRGTESRSRLQQHWREVGKGSASGWCVWTARPTGDELGGPGPEFKLYVSPAMEALRPTFEAMVRVLPSCRARSLKVGATAADLLRPDKIVMYFSDLGDLTSAAHRLADRLQGILAQGVPFTSEISGGGLLSWSVDPPAAAAGTFEASSSWRTWITHRAALALVAAQRQVGSETATWRGALEKLRREGVDTERWLPAATQWASASAWR